MAEASQRYAVVTGGNKGIGFGICEQLASKGIVVVLTARDEKRGLEAVQKLKDGGLSDYVVYHQLDVADEASIASLAHFVKTQFGKLDILVNNAGIVGAKLGDSVNLYFLNMLNKVNNADIFGVKLSDGVVVKFLSMLNKGAGILNWNQLLIENSDLAEECLKTNYYGAKNTTEALIPLLQLSDSPRIVNVSSIKGKLKNVTNEWSKGVLVDSQNLTDEKVDEVLSQYLKDYKEGALETKGWPPLFSAYLISKAAMNAYTRILARKYPNFRVNCVCPGFVKTDVNFNMGVLSIEEGAKSPVKLALLPNDGPTGCFFDRMEESSF